MTSGSRSAEGQFLRVGLTGENAAQRPSRVCLRKGEVIVNRRQTETRFVLFDLGGVLIDLGGVEEFGELIGVRNTDEIWRRWLTSPWVRRYERGQCTREEFAVGIVVENDIDLPPEEFLHKFRDWPKGLLPGAAELVQGLAGGVTSACLSNTNEMHDPPWVLWTPKQARECAGRCSWAHGSDDGSPRRSSRRRCGSVCGTTAASGRWLGSWT